MWLFVERKPSGMPQHVNADLLSVADRDDDEDADIALAEAMRR